MLLWLVAGFAVVIVVNLLAGWTTGWTIGAMRAMSDFATTVRQLDTTLILYYNAVAYPAVLVSVGAYLWPLFRYARSGGSEPPSLQVQRCALSAPVVVAFLSFVPWLISLAVFPAATMYLFGRWSPELMSQHILSPLVNGFLGATTSYFVLDWAFRRGVVPHVFPAGDLHVVPGAMPLGVRSRLLVFLIAVAFVPLFTMLGLARGAADRLAAGIDVTSVAHLLEVGSTAAFVLYVLLGAMLTALLARWLTRPLADVAAGLRRVRGGDLDVAVAVTSIDEVGLLQSGVNQMVGALRDNERILQTFGRVVEPVVRDRLLAGDLEGGGELRTATVLFCDLRDFTAFAERTPPRVVVQTLNEFFAAMTAEARASGGFVDKFIGDAMLVVFGLFEGRPGTASAHGARAAVACAEAMSRSLRRLNAERVADGRPPLAFRGAVHSGPVVAGMLGSTDRHEYTVIGDTVNVAARLLQVAKERDWEFVISGATHDLARSAGWSSPVEGGAAVELRGRSQPVSVFRVLE